MTTYPAGSYEAIAWEWFPLIADRLRHPLDPATVDAYVRAFRQATISTRGLVASCEELFAGTKWWPSPYEFIQAAKAAEVRFRQAEQKAAPPDEQPPEDRLAKVKAFAQEWVDGHRAEYEELVAAVNAEFCARYKLADVRGMTPTQKEYRDASIVSLCAKRAYAAARAAQSEHLVKVIPSKVPWDKQVSRARAKVAEMFAKGTTSAAGGSSVSGGSQLEQTADK